MKPNQNILPLPPIDKSRTFRVYKDEFGVETDLVSGIPYDQAFAKFIGAVEGTGFLMRSSEDHIDFINRYYEWIFSNGGDERTIYFIKNN